MGEGKVLGEVEAAALKELVDVAVELKKSGVLGMLKEIASSADSLMEGIEADTSFMRLGLLLGALLEASRRLDAGKTAGLKMNTEDAAYCLLDTLASTKPGEAKEAGLVDLLKALGDPDVKRGLGYLLAVAKNLGACLGRL